MGLIQERLYVDEMDGVFSREDNLGYKIGEESVRRGINKFVLTRKEFNRQRYTSKMNIGMMGDLQEMQVNVPKGQSGFGWSASAVSLDANMCAEGTNELLAPDEDNCYTDSDPETAHGVKYTSKDHSEDNIAQLDFKKFLTFLLKIVVVIPLLSAAVALGIPIVIKLFIDGARCFHTSGAVCMTAGIVNKHVCEHANIDYSNRSDAEINADPYKVGNFNDSFVHLTYIIMSYVGIQGVHSCNSLSWLIAWAYGPDDANWTNRMAGPTFSYIKK